MMHPLWPLTIGALVGCLMAVVLWGVWEVRIWWRWKTALKRLGRSFGHLTVSTRDAGHSFENLTTSMEAANAMFRMMMTKALDEEMGRVDARLHWDDPSAPWVIADLFRLHRQDMAMEAYRAGLTFGVALTEGGDGGTHVSTLGMNPFDDNDDHYLLTG